MWESAPSGPKKPFTGNRTYQDLASEALLISHLKMLRNRPELIIPVVVFWGLYETKLFSLGWLIIIGLILTALLYVATGLVRRN
jgi:hypothetical protein